MGIRLTLAFSIYLLYCIRSFDCFVESDPVVLEAEGRSDAAEPEWRVDGAASIRAKRHSSSLIDPPSARKRDADALSQRTKTELGGGFSLSGHEYDNQPQTEPPAPADGSTNNPQGDSAGSSTSDPNAQNESGGGGSGAAAAAEKEEIIPPLVVYLIIAGIVLMMIALLVIGIAILYIIFTIPANDKDEDEEDACGKGNARSFPSAPSSRCPSLPRQKVDEPRYSEQSVDLVHKSRGSSLSRQSSCRICPRFSSKSGGGRVSCASTGTSGSGGSDDAAAVAATTARKKDYFVACVCDLPSQEEYSPSASTTTTFGRC